MRRLPILISYNAEFSTYLDCKIEVESVERRPFVTPDSDDTNQFLLAQEILAWLLHPATTHHITQRYMAMLFRRILPATVDLTQCKGATRNFTHQLTSVEKT